MNAAYQRVTVELAGGEESCNWCLRPGECHAVGGREAGDWRELLDLLGGSARSRRDRVRTTWSGGEGSGRPADLPPLAVLPPAGAEVFVGTTVGEQMEFYGPGEAGEASRQRELDAAFGFGFFESPGRSVWELGTGERRCLLLISQLRAHPGLWLLDEPLGCLDGRRRRAMLDFIVAARGNSAAVVAGTDEPAGLWPSATHLLIVTAGLEVEFSGKKAAAETYLAERRGYPLDALRDRGRRRGKD